MTRMRGLCHNEGGELNARQRSPLGTERVPSTTKSRAGSRAGPIGTTYTKQTESGGIVVAERVTKSSAAPTPTKTSEGGAEKSSKADLAGKTFAEQEAMLAR